MNIKLPLSLKIVYTLLITFIVFLPTLFYWVNSENFDITKISPYLLVLSYFSILLVCLVGFYGMNFVPLAQNGWHTLAFMWTVLSMIIIVTASSDVMSKLQIEGSKPNMKFVVICPLISSAGLLVIFFRQHSYVVSKNVLLYCHKNKTYFEGQKFFSWDLFQPPAVIKREDENYQNLKIDNSNIRIFYNTKFGIGTNNIEIKDRESVGLFFKNHSEKLISDMKSIIKKEKNIEKVETLLNEIKYTISGISISHSIQSLTFFVKK